MSSSAERMRAMRARRRDGLPSPGPSLLRDADELLKPAVLRTVAALDPPESDAAVIALALSVAGSLDSMTPSVRAAMLGQTAPVLLRVLDGLEARAAKRQSRPKVQPSRLDQWRAARAQSDAEQGFTA